MVPFRLINASFALMRSGRQQFPLKMTYTGGIHQGDGVKKLFQSSYLIDDEQRL